MSFLRQSGTGLLKLGGPSRHVRPGESRRTLASGSSRDVSNQLREVMRNVPQVSPAHHACVISLSDVYAHIIVARGSRCHSCPHLFRGSARRIPLTIPRHDLIFIHVPYPPPTSARRILGTLTIPYGRLSTSTAETTTITRSATTTSVQPARTPTPAISLTASRPRPPGIHPALDESRPRDART